MKAKFITEEIPEATFFIACRKELVHLFAIRHSKGDTTKYNKYKNVAEKIFTEDGDYKVLLVDDKGNKIPIGESIEFIEEKTEEETNT